MKIKQLFEKEFKTFRKKFNKVQILISLVNFLLKNKQYNFKLQIIWVCRNFLSMNNFH